MTRTTFYKRAFIRFKNQTIRAYREAMFWYGKCHANIRSINENMVEMVTEHRNQIIKTIGIVVFVLILILFIVDCFNHKVDNAVQVGIGGIIGAPLVGAVIGILVALLVYFSLWLIDRLLLVTIYIALFIPILIVVPFFGIYLLLVLISQFLLLIPLTFLFLGNRLWLLWRHIFYTCPNRECSYRGLPIYVCPTCGENHDKLWPNKFGLFHHVCSCEEKLPTMNFLGRNKLARLCAACKLSLSEDIGGLPETLIALAGGPGVGKTNFLLMSTQRLMDAGKEPDITAEIVVPKQQLEFKERIAGLNAGIPPNKTEVTHTMAYLLRLKHGTNKTLLYYYDAAGEEFTSTKWFGLHQNVKHLNGLILLVDPFSLEGMKHKTNTEKKELAPSQIPFDTIISAIIRTLHHIHFNTRRQSAIPLAVVITKADALSEQEKLGDIKRQLPISDQCEQVLRDWGGRNSIELIRQNFETIRFFACSALGRTPSSDNKQPFKEYGIWEPLLWILKQNQQRQRKSGNTSV